MEFDQEEEVIGGKKKKASKPHRILSVKQKIKQDKEQFQKLLTKEIEELKNTEK